MSKTIKSGIFYVISLLILSISLIIFITLYSSERKERKRLSQNYAGEVLREYNVQQQISTDEFKRLFKEEIEGLKKYGVKSRNIENVVEVKYVFRDTTRYIDSVTYIYDTIKDVKNAEFYLNGNCWEICGRIDDSSIIVDDLLINDEITVALYRERRRCLFGKRRVKAIAISECSGDTLEILRNLKVGRKY